MKCFWAVIWIYGSVEGFLPAVADGNGTIGGDPLDFAGKDRVETLCLLPGEMGIFIVSLRCLCAKFISEEV